MKEMLILVYCLIFCYVTEGQNLLAETLRISNLEDRRSRLQRLGELFFANNIPRPNLAPTSIFESIPANASTDTVGEPNIEEINRREGIAPYLLQGDINLTEKQLSAIERSVITRGKRQIYSGAALWTNNRVFYTFDSSIDAHKREIVRIALNYIQARTCVTFTESATAPNRVRVFSGSGCWSNIGMIGGVQDLSLGPGCDVVGITAHEFAHTLGAYHIQMRDDRDDYIEVDLTNVPPNMQGNFAKLDPSESINYVPYEYGSYMHYGSNTFTTSGNSLIPLDPPYLRTLGSRVISFYDIKMINDHYGCNAQCGSGSAVCANGGMTNPNNCAGCVCPGGYAGTLCNQRPAGCGETLTATTLWQVERFTFGNAQVATLRDTFMTCNYWITAPAGKQIQVRVTWMDEPKCGTGCRVNSIEPKYKADQRVTNPRICCNDMLNYVRTSELNPTPVIAYNRLLTSTFTFHYRYI